MYTKYNFCYLSSVFIHPENEQNNIYQVILSSADFTFIAVQNVSLEGLKKIEEQMHMKLNFSLNDGYLRCHPVNTYNLIDVKTNKEPLILRNLNNDGCVYTFYNLVNDGLENDWYLVADWDTNDDNMKANTFHRFNEIRVSRTTMSCFFRATQKSFIKNVNLVTLDDNYDEILGVNLKVLEPKDITIALPKEDLIKVRVPYNLIDTQVEIFSKHYVKIKITDIPLDDGNPIAITNLIAKALSVSDRMTDSINVINDYLSILYSNLNKEDEAEISWVGSKNTRKGEFGVYFKTETKALQQDERNWIIETALKEILPKATGSIEKCLAQINTYRYDPRRSNLLYIICVLTLSASELHGLLKNTMDYLNEFKKNNVKAMMYLYYVRVAWLSYDLNVKNSSLDLYNSDEVINIRIEEIR